MSENVFLDKTNPPNEDMVRKALAEKYSQLLAIRKFIEDNIGETREEWKHYGKNYGWTLKKFLKKRNLFFIGIYDGYFRIAFVFGDRAVSAIEASEVSDSLKKELAEARKYAEGRGLYLEVKDDSHLEDIKILIRLKVEN